MTRRKPEPYKRGKKKGGDMDLGDCTNTVGIPLILYLPLYITKLVGDQQQYWMPADLLEL
jgi:hypothetical protein